MHCDFKTGFVGDAVACESPIGQDVGAIGIKAAQHIEFERAIRGVQCPEVLGRARVS